MTLYDEATCYRCGANVWTSCDHREATRQPPAASTHLDRRERAALKSGGGKYGFKSRTEHMNRMTRRHLQEKKP